MNRRRPQRLRVARFRMNKCDWSLETTSGPSPPPWSSYRSHGSAALSEATSPAASSPTAPCQARGQRPCHAMLTLHGCGTRVLQPLASGPGRVYGHRRHAKARAERSAALLMSKSDCRTQQVGALYHSPHSGTLEHLGAFARVDSSLTWQSASARPFTRHTSWRSCPTGKDMSLPDGGAAEADSGLRCAHSQAWLTISATSCVHPGSGP